MELELRRLKRRRIDSTPPEAVQDAIPRTLRRFAFTTSKASIDQAFKDVNSSGYSVIVLVGRFSAPSPSLEYFLEVLDTHTRRAYRLR